MNIRCLRRVLLAFLIVGYAPRAMVQEARGTVDGFVHGPGGPSAWVKVVVTSYALASYEGTGATDENGHFSLSGVPAGGGVEVAAFSKEEQLLGKGVGELKHNGETISVDVKVGQ